MNTQYQSTVVPLRPQSAEGLVPLVEAVLFQAGKPVTANQLADAVGSKPEPIKEALSQLANKLESEERGLCVFWTGQAAQLVAKPQYHQVLDRARRSDTDRQKAVVKEYIHSLKVQGRRASTLDGYLEFLNRFMESVNKPVEEIKTRDIRFFLMSEESRGNNRNTLATKTAMLRSFFGWLDKEELLEEKNPMNKVDKPKTDKAAPKYLSHEEIEHLREVAKGLDRVLLEVLYSSGLRVSEAVALDWDDIDWAQKRLDVRDGKGGKARTAPLSTKAILLLKKLQEERKDTGAYVFRSQFDQRMSKESIERRIRKLGEKAGLKKRLTPHVLRHSLATHLLHSGMPIDMVQSLLGHSNVSTTQIYAKTDVNAIDFYYRRVQP